MKRGYSGAVITPCIKGVLKQADRGKGLLEQVELCELLYPVTPRVTARYFTADSDAYAMEMLYEPAYPVAGDYNIWAIETFYKMQPLLANNVWNRQLPPDGSWRKSFDMWLLGFSNAIGPELRELADLFFNDSTPQCVIHGDPTLSNCLYRCTGELVIADPLPAGGKIPGMHTVDLGKMLQSAMGWETEIFGWQYSSFALTRAVLKQHSPIVQARAWFWAAVHCLRIIPYAVERRVEEWAFTKATYATAQARTFESYMRSVSKETSRALRV